MMPVRKIYPDQSLILNRFIIVLILWSFFLPAADCQKDNDPPESPVLTLVTVHPETGFTEIRWSRSNSQDVAGYIVYDFLNGKGFAIDTVPDPMADNYLNTGSRAKYRTEAYVVAAYDTARNVSPLSNPLNTILTVLKTNTCRAVIDISWNPYNPIPFKVTEYRIMVSENSTEWYQAGITGTLVYNFSLSNIRAGTKYCVRIEALLEEGLVSVSNMPCADVRMTRAPEWINADYATVTGSGNILLSFTIDPLSEINHFLLERKKAEETSWTLLQNILTHNKNLNYTDNTASPAERFFYRLSAVNNCGIALINSNIASNIVTEASLRDEAVHLSWTPYSGWRGGISRQTVMVNYGNGYSEAASLSPEDSTWMIDYSEIMYMATGSAICFYVTASENTNELGITGSSQSNIACIEPEEKIFVPNTFTPDDDNINDFFKPVMSFIPASYLLVITDRNNRVLFESRDHLEQWDGKNRGTPLPSGVYLWYVRATTPSGKNINRSGTVTILRNR